LLRGWPVLRSEEGPNRDVFVHVFPVNADAAPDQSPVGALLGRSAKKSREPRQWRGDAAPVYERDD